MSDTSGQRHPNWMEGISPPQFETLRHSSHLKHDVIVIGGGISGLTSAYLLKKEGLNVLLLEDGEIGSGETGRTTAHLASGLDDRYFTLIEEHGVVGALKAYKSHDAAINLIESISMENKIDCDFKRVEGYLFSGENDPELNIMKKELNALKELGIPHEWFPSFSLESSPKISLGAAIRFPGQGQFHPTKYIFGLAKLCKNLGVDLYTHSHVSQVDSKSDGVHVTTSNGHTTSAKSVVVATNAPVVDKFTMFTKLHAYRSYVIGASVPKGSFPPSLLWDTEDPYHYVRMAPKDASSDILIIGGEDHLTGHEHDFSRRIQKLEEWSRKKFPMITQVTHQWSGQILEPVDSLGFMGRNPRQENVYIITGDSGNGLTHGTLGAQIITDLIRGRENEYASLYNPSRKMIDEPKEYITENLQASKKYIDWLKTAEKSDFESIPKGEGAIVRVGIKKEAVYKDEEGHTYKMSAVCPHMKGMVNWNPYEKSWDCPIHGSRFDRFGQVINGPSIENLTPLDFPKKETKSGRHHLYEELKKRVTGVPPHSDEHTTTLNRDQIPPFKRSYSTNGNLLNFCRVLKAFK